MKLTSIAAAALSLALVASATAQTGQAFSDYSKPVHATVSIMALSTTSHNGYSGSQDVYFADIQVKDGEHHFVKLVDIYEGYGYPIRRSLLTNRQQFKMDIVRQIDCDSFGRDLFVPPTTQIYDAATPDRLRSNADEVVPCYRTVHKSIKVVKQK